MQLTKVIIIIINNDDDDDMSSSDEEFEDGIDLEKEGNEALQQQNVKYKMKKKKKSCK